MHVYFQLLGESAVRMIPLVLMPLNLAEYAHQIQTSLVMDAREYPSR